jgi:hypothetical protein
MILFKIVLYLHMYVYIQSKVPSIVLVCFMSKILVPFTLRTHKDYFF